MEKRFSPSILVAVSFFFFQVSFLNLNAKLDFANQSASIVLKSNDSRFKVSSSDYINGWKEQSIILKSGNDNSWIPDNTFYGYETGDTNPPSHFLFNNSNAIVDHNRHFTSLNDGKLYAIGSIAGEASLDGRAIISGSINLSGATLSNGGDILFSSQTIIESSGYLSPQGNAYILGGDLSLPDDVILTFTSSGIIDGQGHTLSFGNNAQILIDSDVTVTFINLTVKNDSSTFTIPPIKCLDWYSKLTLENIKFAFNGDFVFKTGQIYFHNDVIFTGTSRFTYQSVLPSYIQPHSTLYFDKNTVFDYNPSSTRNDLITLTDQTSSIYLNGCTLQTTDTGIKLTKGQLFCDNKVTLSNKYIHSLDLTSITSKSHGNRAWSVSWIYSGKYLAVGAEDPPDVVVYEWNGSSLIQKDTKTFEPFVLSVAWSPNGNYLAVGGYNPPDDVIVYEWNGSTLTQKDTKAFGSSASSVAWSPNGNYLAVAGNDAPTDVVVYEWNGSTLTQKDTKAFGSAAYSVNWSPDGNYLAVGGDNDTTNLIVYEWNGSILAQKDTKDFGSSAYSVGWSPDGNYLAVGGSNSSTDIIVYEWNDSILTQKDTKDFGLGARSVAWNPSGDYLTVGGINSSSDIAIYLWNGSYLTQKTTADFGSGAFSANWNPDANYLAVGGENGSTDVIIYRTNYSFIENSPTFYNSIIFGDSEKGSDYDLDVNILSGAQVILDGVAWFDNSITSSRKLDFANMCSSFVLSDTNSKFKITNSENISGWKEQSILLKSGNDNSWISDNTIYGFNITDTNPPNHLIFNDSNAIVNIQENVIENSNAIINISDDVSENSNAIINNSNSIYNNAQNINYNSQAIVTNKNNIDTNTNNINYNSQAIVTNRTDIDSNDNDINYNSQAIVTLENLTSDLIIENSNAIVTLENITEDLTIQNSNAIANHFEHFISMNNGKLYVVGSISGEASIDGRAILSSPINLNGATLSNGGDLLFSSQTTIESSGYLSPQGNAYILGGDLSLPENTTLTFTSNGIIDGQGHILNFGNNAQILIDSNITVTFRNLTLQNSTNDQTIPPIKCLDWYSKLVLENVKFALNDDFIFKTGQMYFHDDVVFTGSSKFSYQSTLPSYITSQASLHFDNETTFEYYPSCTRDDLIVLCDETSDIFLNGCTLQTTHTGIKLAKGRLFLDNKTTLSSATNTILDSLTLIDSENIGEYVRAIDWSPNQHYLSVGCENPNSGQELQLYSFYNDTLTSYTSKQYGVDSPAIYTTKFSPDGKYLAIGGHTNNPRGDKEFQIYSFYNDTLSTYTIQSKDTAWWVAEVAWSPSGDNISLANYWPITAHEDIELYGFQNAVLTTYTNRDFGSRVYSTDWRPDEKYIAFGGKIPTDTAELHIYSFDNSTMSDAPAFIRDYGSSSSYLLTTKWSPDGQYFAIGGHKPHSGNELQIYSLINDTLSTYTSKNYGTEIQSISWSPDGQYLAMGGRNAGDELQIYSFKSGQLSSSPLISQSWGYEIYSVEWSPDGNYLAVGGNQPDSGNELEIYKVNYRFDTTSQTLSNAIIFGDSEKGSDYDLDVNILSGAQVILNGVSWFDNSITSSRKMDFASIGSSFVLSGTDSKFKITNSENISGWKEESIVSESGNDNSWIPGDITYGHLGPETPPPARLLYHNSNAIINLKENSTENSNAIINISDDISENSSAIINNSNSIYNNAQNINSNSQAIVTNRSDIDSNDNDINYNSQAIVTIDNDMALVKLIAQNSAAIIGNSNSIVTLDRNVTENSNAIVNNSWAIADLNNQIHENSWAIQNLIEHGEAIELVAQNSNAIFSASQSIVTLDREIAENSNAILNNQSAINNNSQAIVKLNDYIIDNSNFIEDNSWAILALADNVNENSMAIVTNKTDIDSNDDDINYNSQAIVTNKTDIDTNTNNILYNSNAIVTLDNLTGELIVENSNAIVNISEDVIENSSAIVTNRTDINSNDTDISALQDDVSENSSAIVVNQNDIDTNTNNINYNSQAIVTIDNLTGELIVENSNAIVTLENITGDLIVENSNAIANHFEHFISMNNGKLYIVGSISGETIINGRAILSSPIDLNGATLTNGGDIFFSSQTTIASYGYLSPQGHTYIFGGDLIIPDDVVLTVSTDGTMDGQGYNLVFGNNAQILIDGNITLTLKNLTINNSLNTKANPPIRCTNTSRLTLDSVKFALDDDFVFNDGQLFIHNDVIITGSSKFSYHSVLPSYIQSHACLYFDKNTIFDYSPNSTRNDLITLTDKTSSIYLNGCALQTTDTGIRLTKGQLFCDNKITLSNTVTSTMANFYLSDSKNQTAGSAASCLSWNPDNNYVVIGGLRLQGWLELETYSFNNGTFSSSAIDSKDYGSDTSTEVYSVDWSPNNNYIALGGYRPSSNNQLQVYSVNNGTLSSSPVDSIAYGDYSDARVYSVAWHPNGNYLAMGGKNPTSGDEFQIYSFADNTLTFSVSRNYGDGVSSVAWNNIGNYIAVGGYTPDSTHELQIYSFDTSLSTSPVDSRNYGSQGFSSRIYSIAWSTDGKYLAIGGNNPDSYELQIYSFNNGSLSISPIASKNFSANIESISWSKNGKYLSVAGGFGSDQLQIYSVNNGILSTNPIFEKRPSTQNIDAVAWDNTSEYLGVGLRKPASGHYELEVYKSDYTFLENNPTFYNSIIFGDSSKGSDYDLDVYVLGGAQVKIDGQIWLDNSN